MVVFSYFCYLFHFESSFSQIFNEFSYYGFFLYLSLFSPLSRLDDFDNNNGRYQLKKLEGRQKINLGQNEIIEVTNKMMAAAKKASKE